MRKWLFDLFSSSENSQEDAPGTSSNMEIAAGFVLAIVVLFLFVLTNEAIRKSNAKKLSRLAASHVNRLKDSPDPYLRASAALPIDWYPMGEEAITAAKVQNKPIFISSGYGSHWSNVMDRDVFQDPEVAAALNKGFICIRVDRDVRPDVDAFCMDVQMVLTSRAAWPLNVWLTPDFKPFHATEFATASEFLSLVNEISKEWLADPEKMVAKARNVSKAILAIEGGQPGGNAGMPGKMSELTAKLERDLLLQEDKQNGGVGSSPRLPHLPALQAALTIAATKQASPLSDLVMRAANGMVAGAIRDQVRGGYFRFTEDAAWRKPHFEKILADQAMFALFYFDVADYCDTQNRSTGETWRKEGASVLKFAIANMKTADAGGYGTMIGPDIDTGEGTSYLWTRSKVAQTLPAAAVSAWCEAYGISTQPRLREEAVAPYRARPPFDPIYQQLEAQTVKLAARAHTEKMPPLEAKSTAGPCGWLLMALVRGWKETADPAFLREADEVAKLIVGPLAAPGASLHRYVCGGRGYGEGRLDDYAACIRGLMAYGACRPNAELQKAAVGLCDTMCAGIKAGMLLDAGSIVAEDASLARQPLPQWLGQDDTLPGAAGTALNAIDDQLAQNSEARTSGRGDARRAAAACLIDRFGAGAAEDRLHSSSMLLAARRHGLMLSARTK